VGMSSSGFDQDDGDFTPHDPDAYRMVNPREIYEDHARGISIDPFLGGFSRDTSRERSSHHQNRSPGSPGHRSPSQSNHRSQENFYPNTRIPDKSRGGMGGYDAGPGALPGGLEPGGESNNQTPGAADGSIGGQSQGGGRTPFQGSDSPQQEPSGFTPYIAPVISEQEERERAQHQRKVQKERREWQEKHDEQKKQGQQGRDQGDDDPLPPPPDEPPPDSRLPTTSSPRSTPLALDPRTAVGSALPGTNLPISSRGSPGKAVPSNRKPTRVPRGICWRSGPARATAS
jgi:hypothetical protein